MTSFDYYSILAKNIPGLEVLLIDNSYEVLCKLGTEAQKQGWGEPNEVNKSISTIFPKEIEDILTPLLKIGFESTPISLEFRTNKNHFSVRIIPLTKTENQLLCILIIQNITEPKLIEKKSHNSMNEANEANRAKDNFVAKISHEIRTPLTAIAGFTEQLENTRLTKKQSDYINIVNNAIKFTRKGSVSVSCHLIKNTQHQQTINFEVSDTGVGIGADELKNIFKPFHQVDISLGRKYEGCCLGLTISKNLVESMGGNISVESTPGIGSTFKFTLSFKKVRGSDRKLHEKEKHAKHLPLNQLQILFVDDDPVNLLLGKILLNKFGIKADFANSGSDALDKFKKGRYDMIFLDINMPDYNGLEVTERIREEEKDLKDSQKSKETGMKLKAN